MNDRADRFKGPAEPGRQPAWSGHNQNSVSNAGYVAWVTVPARKLEQCIKLAESKFNVHRRGAEMLFEIGPPCSMSHQNRTGSVQGFHNPLMPMDHRSIMINGS